SPKARRRYMLSGVVRCGACGGVLSSNGGSKGRRYYRCANARAGTCENRTNVEVNALEVTILSALQNRLRACVEEVRSIVAEEIAAYARNAGDQRSELERRLAERQRQVDNVVDVLASAPSAALARKLAELEREVERIQAELAGLTAEAPPLSSVAELTGKVLSLRALDTMDPDHARTVLRAL